MPAAPFNAVAWPAGVAIPLASNAEIVRVTAIATDTLTITRAQEGTTAKSIAVGWQIDAGLTVLLLQQYAPSGIASARAFVSSTSQTIASGATAAVTSLTADTTYGNVGITLATGGFTIVTAGKYRVDGSVQASFATAPTLGVPSTLQFTKNGTPIGGFVGLTFPFIGDLIQMAGSVTVKCAVGDVIAMQVVNQAGQTEAISSGTGTTWLSAVLESQ